MNDLISVIIPVYNVEKYLDESLKSVINQTYRNLEIIVINDGSTDDSYNICKKYAEKDKRIVLINQKNQGLGNARNRGLKIAKGKYIAFVDSDDYIEKDMYNYLINLINKYDADISICGHNIIKNGKIIEVVNRDLKKNLILSKNEAIKLIIEDKMINSFSCDKLYKINLFDNVRYPSIKYHEDIATIFKTFINANKIVIGKEPKYNYRRNVNSISFNLTPIKTYHSFLAYYEIHSVFLEYEKNFQSETIIKMALSAIASLNTFIRNNLYKENKDEIDNIRIIIKKNIKKILINKKICFSCKLYCVLSIYSMFIYKFVCRLNINKMKRG